MTDDQQPTTQQMRAVQRDREQAEREASEDAPTGAAERAHARRADKAAYLESKLADAQRSEEQDS